VRFGQNSGWSQAGPRLARGPTKALNGSAEFEPLLRPVNKNVNSKGFHLILRLGRKSAAESLGGHKLAGGCYRPYGYLFRGLTSNCRVTPRKSLL